MTCMLNCPHVWDGPPITMREECETCAGTGRDLDADYELDDVRFPECFDCGGDGGEDIVIAATCSGCGCSEIDAVMAS